MPHIYQIILTEDQKDEIAFSKKEIAVIGVKDDEVLDKEIRQWLKTINQFG